LFVHDLPDDELARYRGAIEAVTADDVLRVASEHIRPDTFAIVLVGDHEQFGDELEAQGLGPIEIVRDPEPMQVAAGDAADEILPVDAGEGGPAEGAEEPELPGGDDPADPGTADEPDAVG
ncbi:MAG TPA: hypothetical protein VKB30_07180, partial [Candidatus Limnocylindrales bacterium]|nr:hypothetical protein [Candidatus Limnocylindrales bacterium]